MSGTAGEQLHQQLPAVQDLQHALHTATRNVHMQLNKTITARLPLCLPPLSEDPLPYHLGMIAFGEIFVQFERAIENILKGPRNPSNHDMEVIRTRHIQVLQAAQTPALLRSERLVHDSQILCAKLRQTSRCKEAQEQLEQLEQTVTTQAQAITTQIGEHVTGKPYLALAYTWTMYLALFNGGRWLHRQLASPGPSFWLEEADVMSAASQGHQPVISALTFWHFEAATKDDPEAERLKLTFKRRFNVASEMLTESERQDIVLEAKNVFEICLKLIELLDATMPQHAHQKLETETWSTTGVAARIWQVFDSTILSPVSDRLGWNWAQPLKDKVRG